LALSNRGHSLDATGRLAALSHSYLRSSVFICGFFFGADDATATAQRAALGSYLWPSVFICGFFALHAARCV